MNFSSLNRFLDSIVELLKEKLGDSITVERQFPNKVKPHPLNKITVAIGTNKRHRASKCIGNILTSAHIGTEVTIGIEVAIYIPLSIDSDCAYTVIDEIFSVLKADERFGVMESEHGVLSANRATGSFELHSTLTATLYETEE